MFRGGPVDSRGTGITTGLDQPRIGARTGRFFGDTGNPYTPKPITTQGIIDSYTPRGLPQSFIDFFQANQANQRPSGRFRKMGPGVTLNESELAYEEFPEISSEMPSGLTASADLDFFPSSPTDTGGIEDLKSTADVELDLYALDLDEDGDVDVLSSSMYDHEITLYENNGSQTFTTYIIGTAVNGTRSVYAGDMDNDGDTDIIATALNDDEVIVYTNETSGLATASFVSNTITTAADGAQSVFSIDVDSDGDMDIISASYYDDKIAWYLSLIHI